MSCCIIKCRERPADASAKALVRATDAQKIYDVMKGR